MSWYDAVRYCNWLSEREGRTPAYTIGGYRLPAETEWGYAACEEECLPGV